MEIDHDSAGSGDSSGFLFGFWLRHEVFRRKHPSALADFYLLLRIPCPQTPNVGVCQNLVLSMLVIIINVFHKYTYNPSYFGLHKYGTIGFDPWPNVGTIAASFYFQSPAQKKSTNRSSSEVDISLALLLL